VTTFRSEMVLLSMYIVQQVLIESLDINFGFKYLINQQDVWNSWNMLDFWIPTKMSWHAIDILVE
jgi:hypothetical protein